VIGKLKLTSQVINMTRKSNSLIKILNKNWMKREKIFLNLKVRVLKKLSNKLKN